MCFLAQVADCDFLQFILFVFDTIRICQFITIFFLSTYAVWHSKYSDISAFIKSYLLLSFKYSVGKKKKFKK